MTLSTEETIKEMRTKSPIFIYRGDVTGKPVRIPLLYYKQVPNPNYGKKHYGPFGLEDNNRTVMNLEIVSYNSASDDGLIGKFKSIKDIEDYYFSSIAIFDIPWTSIYNVNQCTTKVARSSRRGRANTILCNKRTLRKHFGDYIVISTIGRWKEVFVNFKEDLHFVGNGTNHSCKFFISDDVPNEELICCYIGSNVADVPGVIVKDGNDYKLFSENDKTCINYLDYAIKLKGKKETKCQILLRWTKSLHAGLMSAFKK